MTYKLKDGVYKAVKTKPTELDKLENLARASFIKHFKNYNADFTRHAKTKSNIYLYGHSMPFIDEKTELVFIGYFAGYLKGKK